MMWTTENILAATKGSLLRKTAHGRPFSGIAIDSRTIKPDELFIAIKGDVFNGHDFIKDAVNKGVRGVVLNAGMAHSVPPDMTADDGTVFISVPDTFRALGDLAYYKRTHTDVSVVGITGSNGKTSTREMTASIAAQQFRVLTPRGNFNNEIGLPLTLFQLDDSYEWAILELAMNHPGEIKRLSGICLPDIGVITNIGPAHLEGLGSIDGVMHAKGELLESLSPSGTAVLNADDPMTPRLVEKTNAAIMYFGISKPADITAHDIKDAGRGIHFSLNLPDGQVSIDLTVPGRFMVSNALAAAAVGHCLGLSPGMIKKGLEQFTPVKGRMNIIATNTDIHIIDDTYNSNPGSMTAAIHTLHTLRKDSRGAVVAGDMCELGNESRAAHRQIGALSASSGVSKLYITGEFAQDMAAGAREAGMDAAHVIIGSKEDIIDQLLNWVAPGDWVLVKGSRAVGMETIVKGITDQFQIK